MKKNGSRGNKLTKCYLFIFLFRSSSSPSLLAFLLSPGKGDELLDRVPERKRGRGLGIVKEALSVGKGVLLRDRVRIAGTSAEVTVPDCERGSGEWGVGGGGATMADVFSECGVFASNTGVTIESAWALSVIETVGALSAIKRGVVGGRGGSDTSGDNPVGTSLTKDGVVSDIPCWRGNTAASCSLVRLVVFEGPAHATGKKPELSRT